MLSIACQTLFKKEVLRFWRVSLQTVAAPVLTSLLYLLVFAHVLEGKVEPYPGVSYATFLVPGLVMMAILQNAFANSSSSLIQSKITGNIIFLLLPPFTHAEFFTAYLLSSVVRGILVGGGVWAVSLIFVPHLPVQGGWFLYFALMGSCLFGAMGIIGGLWSEKFDQLSAIQNFVVLPLTFLSGVFYSVHSLSPFWQMVSHFDPVFYVIDGFRYGFFGHADTSPWLSASVVFAVTVAMMFWCYRLIQSGYRMRQ